MSSANFAFQTTKRIVVELGGAKTQLPQLVKNVSDRVFLVSDKGLTGLGLVEPARQHLQAKGVDVVVFDDVCEDPSTAVVHNAVAAAKESGAGAVVGLGGGSSMDVAKLVSVLASPTNTQTIEEMYGIGMIQANAPQTRRLPLFQVPTTAGTGSEVTQISIVTTESMEKKGIVDPMLLPDAAVLDGELTVSVPKHVTSATGIDAMVHAIEAFTSRLLNNPVSDAMALGALDLLGKNIRTVVEEPTNLQARSDMLVGSCMAGIAFANSPVAAVHALAYPIGSHFHVPHGLSNALMLPHVIRANNEVLACAVMYSKLAPYCLPTSSFTGGPSEVAEQFADAMAQLSRELGMKTTLREVGIQAKDIDLLASEAMKQQRLLVNNQREVDLALATQLYTSAL